MVELLRSRGAIEEIVSESQSTESFEEIGNQPMYILNSITF
jgi:hypothetical protein